MPLSVNDIRQFAGNDRLLFDPKAQGGTLQSVNKWQRFKSFFNIGDARLKNIETITAIHNAILNDPDFFAQDIREKAWDLLSEVRTDRAISAAQIRNIIKQLDADSTRSTRRAAAQKLVGSHAAARGLPAFVPQSASDAYVALAKVSVLPREEPPHGFGRFDYAAALDAFDAKMGALFTRLGNGAGDKDVFCSIMYKACKDKKQAQLDALVDALRANLDESRALGTQYGEQTRLNVVEALKTLEKPIPPTPAVPNPLRALVDAGRAVRVPSLETLNGQSSPEDIDQALSEFSTAITRSPVLAAVKEPGDRGTVQVLLTRIAVNAMPDAAKAGLLDALESDTGKNLVSFYAGECFGDAPGLYGTAKYIGLQLKADLGRPNPEQSIPLPPSPDPTRLPVSFLYRYSFAADHLLSGDATGPFRGVADRMEQASAGDPFMFRRKSSELAAAKTTLGICGQLKESVVDRDEQGREIAPFLNPDICTSFVKDLNRGLNVRFPDGTAIVTKMPLDAARDLFLRFVTGDASATWAGAGHADKVKVLVLMSFTNQNANGIAEESVFEALAGGRNEAYQLPVTYFDDNKSRIESHEFSKDANGDITVRLRFRQPLASMGVGNYVPAPLSGESYREFEMEAKLPAANLDALAHADWAGLDMAEAKAIDSRIDKPDCIDAVRHVSPECRFTGTATVSAHLHLVKA